MALLTLDDTVPTDNDKPLYVSDPCCGTGRMLLEAAKVNPRVELVGQDLDPRCAKITAINLGLRSRYGWVICGNTITNELRFAYRVGSFYHESPNGLRRGVIREVPISDMSVVTIAEEVRGATSEAIGEQGDEDASAVMQWPSIIEVPQWLARLEPKLARREHAGGERDDGKSPQRTEQDGQAPTQRTLF
ncbi:MAG TPA: N-6 DNA methylase [Pirellulales bacterium]|nr:N-6 DNA methylase [Pirellulales bacterium]